MEGTKAHAIEQIFDADVACNTQIEMQPVEPKNE
jgi:hypothetical protein